LSLNCCSLRSPAKRALFHTLIDEHKPDIICGCESHLDSSYYNAENFPTVYTVLRKDRVEGAGGVFLCIKEDLEISEQPELNVDAEIIWAKISFSKKSPIYICSFYRPPDLSTDPILQLQLSLNTLTRRFTDLPNIIVMGDFNLPGINWLDGYGQLGPHPSYGVELNNLFLDVINDIGLNQFVNTPTRNNNVLDLVLSTSSNIADLTISPGMSDHEAVVFCYDLENTIIDTKPEHKVALYHRASLDDIRSDLLEFQTDFLASDPYSKTVEENWTHLKSAINDSVTKYVPFKTVRSSFRLPWINREIKKDMKKRKKLYNIAKRTKSSSDWNAYRIIKNSINNKIKVAHNNYFSRMFDDSFDGNRRQFWKYIRAKRKDFHNISTLTVNGKVISDSKSKADALNNYFESVFTKEDLSNIPSMSGSENPPSTLSAMASITFSVAGIQQQLSLLDSNKASGPDNIHSYILKNCANEISPILQIIFTQSLNTGRLPSDWLVANVCPVFKRGSRSNAANYRPISLTSVCSKVMEHIIYHSIMEHLNSNNILIDSQHGFRSQHSCVTQLISLIEDLSHALDQRKQTDVILLDFSKAFDSVPHQRLLVKLRHYGINSHVCQWINTWLTRRSQRVALDGSFSNPVSVHSGVPQGTVLGPLMFLLYINDITEHIKSPLRLFADDCLLYRIITSKEDTIQLQHDLDQLQEWADKWQLKFNVTKCTIMRFTRSLSPIIFNYKLGSHSLGTSNQHPYLGVILDSKLQWTPHINNTAAKANRTLNFLKRNLSCCSSNIKASAYLTLVRPTMEYAAVVWDPYHHNNIQQLEKVQRRAARWVLNDFSHHSSVTSMIQQLSWPSLQLRRKVARLQTLFKIVHHDYSLSIPSYFTPMERSTRQYHPQRFILPNSFTYSHQQSFYPRSIKDWNDLPPNLIDSNNIDSFTAGLQSLYRI